MGKLVTTELVLQIRDLLAEGWTQASIKSHLHISNDTIRLVKNDPSYSGHARQKRPGLPCSVQGCDRPHESKGYCASHANRLRKHGDVRAGVPFYSIHNEVTVDTAHWRIKRLWGSASQYPCIECGNPAKDWAYDGTDPTELFGEHKPCQKIRTKMRYSRFPEFYMPMCRPCHGRRDGAEAAREREIFRTIMHELKLTAEEVAAKLGVVV